MIFSKVGLLLSSLVLCISTAFADINSDAEIIFDWAELTYSELFNPSSTTQSFDEWRYRYYPNTDNYIGINDKGEVAVLGKQFGDDILVVGTVEEFLEEINVNSFFPEINTINLEGNDVEQVGNNVIFSSFRDLGFSLYAYTYDHTQFSFFSPPAPLASISIADDEIFFHIEKASGETFYYILECNGDFCGAKFDSENKKITLNNISLPPLIGEFTRFFSPRFSNSTAPIVLNGIIQY